MKKILSILALLSIISAGNVVARDGGKGAPKVSATSATIVQANLLRLKKGQVLTAQQKSDLISNAQKLERDISPKRRSVAKLLQRSLVPSTEVVQAAINEGRKTSHATGYNPVIQRTKSHPVF